MKSELFTTLALLSSTALFGATNSNQCAPDAPAACNADECCRTYCLGPETMSGNPPVLPRTCDGDIELTVAGFYWIAHEDGLDYAIDDAAIFDSAEEGDLIDARFQQPHFNWDFGFKVGLGYNSPCDGWDLSVLWTRYQGKASSHIEAEEDDNHTLLTLWSDLGGSNLRGDVNLPIFATDIETSWKLDLNMIDIELGRDTWISRKLALRPHVGIRVAFVNQSYDIFHSGGTFSDFDFSESNGANGEVDLDNDFKGVGIRSGLDTTWNFGCGWSLYGNAAFSILYGKFDVDYDEDVRKVETPFSKRRLLETESHFRASRYVADLGLGIQWISLFCNCDYALTVQFGWEQHIFFNQNQLWRVVQGDDEDVINCFQRRGDLDTQGWTLSFSFDF